MERRKMMRRTAYCKVNVMAGNLPVIWPQGEEEDGEIDSIL
jgi:hypothetical protein